mmetsp:Transcript_11661/g.32940  ORF Transcript_11661/g.32940 Transcript_11661/m.32940 type:complete len:232 (-) Transcript_11661:46-741(-)
MSPTVALKGSPRNCTADGLRPSSSPGRSSGAGAVRSLGLLALLGTAASASPPASAPAASMSPGTTLLREAPAAEGGASALPPGRGSFPTVSVICSAPGGPDTSKSPGKPCSHLQMLSVSSARRRSAGGRRSRIRARARLRPGHCPRLATRRARISLSLGTRSSGTAVLLLLLGSSRPASAPSACHSPSAASSGATSVSLLASLASPPLAAAARLCLSPIAGHPCVSPMGWA